MSRNAMTEEIPGGILPTDTFRFVSCSRCGTAAHADGSRPKFKVILYEEEDYSPIKLFVFCDGCCDPDQPQKYGWLGRVRGVRSALASAIAEDPDGVLGVDPERAPSASVLAGKTAHLDAAERLAVERVVDLILANRPAREGGDHA